MSTKNVVLLTLYPSNRDILCLPSEQGFSIGMNPQSKLVLDGCPGIDWDHGVLECTPWYGVWVYIDHSIKGTIVNDTTHLIQRACVVEDGTSLRIGSFKIEVQIYSRKNSSSITKPPELYLHPESNDKVHHHHHHQANQENQDAFPTRPEYSSSPSIHDNRNFLRQPQLPQPLPNRYFQPQRNLCQSPRDIVGKPSNPTKRTTRMHTVGNREGKPLKEDLRLLIANKRLAHLKDKPNPQSPIARQKIEEDKKILIQRHQNIQEQDERFINDQEEYFKQMQQSSNKSNGISNPILNNNLDIPNSNLCHPNSNLSNPNSILTHPLANKTLQISNPVPPNNSNPIPTHNALTSYHSTFDTRVFSSVSSSAVTDIARLRRSDEPKTKKNPKSTGIPMLHSSSPLARNDLMIEDKSIHYRRRSFSFEMENGSAVNDCRKQQCSVDGILNLSGKELFLGSLDSSDQSVNSTNSHSNLQFPMENEFSHPLN